MINYTQNVESRVQQITGLTGKPLDLVTTAAIITAETGKYPTKVDMCTCVGMSEREMNVISQEATELGWMGTFRDWCQTANIYTTPKYKAMIYAISADLVAEGLVCGDVDERARELLRSLVSPPLIQTRAQFDGFLTMLEYLHHLCRGLDTTLSSFMTIRYGSMNKRNALKAFARLVTENNKENFPDENYSLVAGKLAELLKVID